MTSITVVMCVYEKDKDIKPQIDLINKNIDRYLNKARSSSNVKIIKSKVKVDYHVEKIASIFQKIHPNKNIKVVVKDKNLLIPGSSEDLDEILGNLLENACKWTKKLVEIKVQRSSKNLVKFTISDDGPGLPKHKRAEVFARGFRLDEQTPGTGLGLNIVKDTVEQYSGKVWLTKSNFGGLTVHLLMPLSV